MKFGFGCLAMIAIIVSLIIGAYHADGDDYSIIHWLLGFWAALVFAGLLVLGTL